MEKQKIDETSKKKKNGKVKDSKRWSRRWGIKGILGWGIAPSPHGAQSSLSKHRDLKMICNDFLVVKVNCP